MIIWPEICLSHGAMIGWQVESKRLWELQVVKGHWDQHKEERFRFRRLLTEQQRLMAPESREEWIFWVTSISAAFAFFKWRERKKDKTVCNWASLAPFLQPNTCVPTTPAHCCCVPLHEANLPRVNVASITFCHKPLIPSQISSLEVPFWTPQADSAAAPLGVQHLSDR